MKIRWIFVSLMALSIQIVIPQERFALRFIPPNGLAVVWDIHTVTRKLVNERAETELTNLTVHEVVKKQPNGNLTWSSRIVRCVINGEVIPTNELSGSEMTLAQVDQLGQPIKPTFLPPPSLVGLDDWISDLLGHVALVFPTAEIGFGQNWTQTISIGLKPPNEPRQLKVVYRLDKREIVDDCDYQIIVVQTEAPIRFVWRAKNFSVSVRGGAKLDSVFWFDLKLGIPRRKKSIYSFSYTQETELWDGFQFVQTTKFVNQQTESEAKAKILHSGR